MSLEHIAMFKDLSKIELAKLLGKLDKRFIGMGSTLFHQGEAGDSIYIVESGKLELFSSSTEGKRQALAVLEEGDTLGEMALLTGEPRSATAVAATDVVLYVIDKETFERLIDEQAAISRYFIRLLSQRLITTNERLHQTKETRSQWMVRELEQFPDSLVQFLLWCAEFPVISRTLAERRFSFSLNDKLEAFPNLMRFLHSDAAHKEWFTVTHEARSVLSDMGTARYGYGPKKQWIQEATAFYEAEGDWTAAIKIYADKGEWPAVLDVIARDGSRFRDQQKKEIYGTLRRCPKELLSSRYSILQSYVLYCLEETPEIGLSMVEMALDTHASSYSAQQLIAVYEWGADLSKKSSKEMQALEYLKLAESAALSLTGSGERSKREDQAYGLAKQKLASKKSQLLSESAGRLVQRGKWTGLFAVFMAFLFIVVSYSIEPFAGLSRQAMIFIGIGIAAVILWIVNIVPDYIVALGMLMLWVLGGVVDSEVAFSGFASPTWFYMIFIMALSAAITKSGILYRFALNALKRFPPHYRGQFWGIVAGGTILNPLIPSSSAKVTLGVPIAQTLSESMGFAERSRGAAGLGLAAMVFYGFTAPFTLTGSYTNMMAYGLASTDQPVTWLQWFLYALPAFILFSAVILLWLSVLFRNTTSPKPISVEVLDEQLRLIGPLSREEIISIVTVFGCIGLMVLQPLHGIDSTWIMLTGFSILVITGVLDRSTVSTGIDWTFLLFLGAAFSFAGAVKELGIAETLSSFLGGHMSVFMSSPYLFLATIMLLSFLVTVVVRDDPAVILLVTALLPLAGEAGIHPWILVFIILLCTDPFFFAYQSPTYLTAYYSSEGKAFTHRQGQMVGVGYALAVMLAVILCIPYWKWLGMIT